MLGKLIKYDLKWTYKILIIFYCLTIFFALVGRGLSLIDSTLFDILSKISCSVSISFVFSSLINNMMRLWARFVQSIYKDESYLTHTLPVTKTNIYMSKFISTIITMLSTFGVSILGIFICYYGDGFVQFLKLYFNDSSISFLCLAGFVLLLEFLFIQFLGYLAIIIGYKCNTNKFIKSLVFGFGIYMGSSFLSVLVLFIVALFNSKIMDLFITNPEIVDISILKYLLVVATIIYLVYIVVCNFVSNKLLNQGVNVD